jgi:hypothetical protein
MDVRIPQQHIRGRDATERRIDRADEVGVYRELLEDRKLLDETAQCHLVCVAVCGGVGGRLLPQQSNVTHVFESPQSQQVQLVLSALSPHPPNNNHTSNNANPRAGERRRRARLWTPCFATVTYTRSRASPNHRRGAPSRSQHRRERHRLLPQRQRPLHRCFPPP